MRNLSNREKQSCARKYYITPIVGTLRVKLSVAEHNMVCCQLVHSHSIKFSIFSKALQSLWRPPKLMNQSLTI